MRPNEQSPSTTRAVLRQKLRIIERGVIIRGTVVGFVSGGAAAAGVYLAEQAHQSIAAHLQWTDITVFYCLSIGFATLITLMEILFLYIDGVKACAKMSVIAQNHVFMNTKNILSLNRALVRAGLELPSLREPLYGIDPMINRSPSRVFLFSLFYKLKVSVSNAILKFALKRIFPKLAGRTFGRSLIEVVSAPVFAVWNFFLCRLIMKQARIRTLGPLLIQDAIHAFWPHGIERATDEELCFAFSALKEAVVLSGFFHFNHILFAERILHAAGDTPLQAKPLKSFLEDLVPQKQGHRLNFITLLLLADGKRPNVKEKWLRHLYQKASLKCAPPALGPFYQMICEGEAITL